MRWLAVRVGDVRCCIEIDALEQVVSLMALTTLPGGPPCLKGFFDYHGSNVAAIDLAERLQLPPQAHYSLDTCVVIAHSEHRRGGLIVDEVYGLIDCPAHDLAHHDDFAARRLPFKATMPTRFGMALCLDTYAVLDVADVLERPQLDYTPPDSLRVDPPTAGGGAA